MKKLTFHLCAALALSLIAFYSCKSGDKKNDGNTDNTDVSADSSADASTMYLITASEFYGLHLGDAIADKSDILTKSVLQTGEGDFDVYLIITEAGDTLGYVDPADDMTIRSISVESKEGYTEKDIRVGNTYADLEKAVGDLTVHGSETEGWTTATKDGITYFFGNIFWTYEVDQSKMDPNTKIKRIDIRG